MALSEQDEFSLKFGIGEEVGIQTLKEEYFMLKKQLQRFQRANELVSNI